MKFIIVLFSFVASFNSYAINVVTEDEFNELDKISSRYDFQEYYTDLNNKLSENRKKSFRYASLLKEIEIIESSYVSYINVGSQTELTNDYFLDIKSLVERKHSIENEISESYSTINEDYIEILNGFDKLHKSEDKLRKEKITLLKSISERLVMDIEAGKNVVVDSMNVSYKCSKHKSLQQCIDESKSEITNSLKNNHFLLDSSSALESFTYTDLSINDKAELTYTLKAKFTPVFTHKTERKLNEILGFSTAFISLKSNQNATWYVDGKNVGNGKLLNIEVPIGHVGIYAEYNGKSQSTIEYIKSDTDLTYKL